MNERRNFSVIIPTINRHLALHETLLSIEKQEVHPQNIFVIDQSDDNTTRDVCSQFSSVTYINSRIKSGTAARNIGIRASIEAGMMFWVFLDDDVELDQGFFSLIYESFLKNKTIIGIAAWVRTTKPMKRSYVSNFLRFLGGFDYCSSCVKMRKNFLATSLWQAPHGITDVEWIQGCAMAVRNLNGDNIFFDEKLILYALAEDRDFSYRLSKIGKTVLIPNLQLLHKAVPEGRIPSRKKIFMVAVHQYYLTKKHFSNSMPSSMLFWWNMLMRWCISWMICTYGYISNNVELIQGGKDIRDSFMYVFFNKKQIGKGDLQAFHKFLLN